MMASQVLDPALPAALLELWQQAAAPRLVTLFAQAAPAGVELRYLLDTGGAGYSEVCVPAAAQMRSATALTAGAAWYEREARDRYGIEFVGHPDPRPLLHDRFLDGRGAPRGEPYPFLQVGGSGVCEIGVGPVHAGIIEPGHFRFSVMGDRVIQLELRHFYTHKGTEDLLAGMPVAAALPLVESVSGDNCFAHAVTYCQAVESIAGAEAPAAAQALRLIGLEYERLLAHIGDFGALCGDIGFAPMAALASRIKEDLLRASTACCGTRYWRGAAIPGGVSAAPPAEARNAFGRAVENAGREFAALAERTLQIPSVEARFKDAGVLRPAAARDWAVVGLAARASGGTHDVRRAQPYGAYRGLEVEVPVLASGDVWARARLRVLEAAVSSKLIRETLANWPAEETADTVVPMPGNMSGHGWGAVESPRGELLYWMALDRGRIERCHIKSPSFQNWPAVPFAVIDGIIADFPMINKSFNLSYSGCDR